MSQEGVEKIVKAIREANVELDCNLGAVVDVHAGQIREIENALQEALPDACAGILRVSELLAHGTLQLTDEQRAEQLFDVLLDGNGIHAMLSGMLAAAKAAGEAARPKVWLTDRVETLMSEIAHASPGFRTVLFLRRVSRWYIAGLDSECIAMARSALEAELNAAISNDECSERFGVTRQERGEPLYSMHARLLVARDAGRITPEAFDAANRVRDKANRVIHRAPEKSDDAIRVIGDCLKVIAELAPARDR